MEEFKGLQLGGIVTTVANNGKKEIKRAFDLTTGKASGSSEPKKDLLNGFIRTYDLQTRGCIESFTLFAKIQTLSGEMGKLNQSSNGIELSQKFSADEKIKKRSCRVELVMKSIDPMKNTSQAPSGDIHMTCS